MWGMPPFIARLLSKVAVEPIITNPSKSSSLKQTNMLISPEKFAYLTGIVIDNFEGGYYHPNMLPSFKPSDQDKLRASGETMFGLDRKAGAQLAKYPEWKVFWDAVDKAKLANPADWGYNERGGKEGQKLKDLTSAIMFKWFSELAGKYLLVSSLDEIAADDRLIIHFAYSCWNGEGWFSKFAKALNGAIAKFPGNKEAIFSEAIKARTMATNKLGMPNKVIRQQGEHMIALFAKLHL